MTESGVFPLSISGGQELMAVVDCLAKVLIRQIRLQLVVRGSQVKRFLGLSITLNPRGGARCSQDER